MIKTADEVLIAIMSALTFDNSEEDAKEHIRQYGRSIVDECCGNFKCTIEIIEAPDQITGIEEVPVLIRASVLAVKNQIQ